MSDSKLSRLYAVAQSLLLIAFAAAVLFLRQRPTIALAIAAALGLAQPHVGTDSRPALSRS